MRDYIQEYRKLYNNGDIKISKKSVQQLERVEAQILNGEVNYSLKHAHHCINWIEKYCKHYKGKFAGKPVILEPWQKYILSVVFGFLDWETDCRITREFFILVARKNGKTTLMAAVALYLLIGDLEAGPEIYSVATKKEQAKILYQDAYKMVQYSPELSSVIKKRRSDMECTFNDGMLAPLASDSNSLDGLNVHAALFDELHAYKDQNIIDVMLSAIGTRAQPMLGFITTNGIVRGKVFDSRYEYYKNIVSGVIEDITIHPFFYELDDVDTELADPNMWEKCNPNMDVSIGKKYLADQLKRAKDDPAQKGGVLTKNFNIPQTSATAYLTADECETNEYDENDLHTTSGVIGLDMSQKIDLTVITYLTKCEDDSFMIKQWYFKGEELVDEHSKIDKVNYRLYSEVELLPGSTVEQSVIYRKIEEIVETYNLEILKFGVDPYRADHILNTLRENYYQEYAVAVSNQYRKAITRTIYKLKDLLRQRKIKFNSKLTSLHLASCQLDVDKHDLCNLIKINKTARIDASISLVYALKAYELYLVDCGFDYEDVWKGDETNGND